ncbi:MAG: PRC-barrel domain-containing protein, partial [Thiogranum sp.]
MARELAGCTLLCADGEIGGIEAFLFDDTSWVVRYLVVTTGARLTGRRALVAPVAVGGVDTNNKTICIELTSMQIENSPPIDTRGRVSRQDEADYYNYYHWPPYWEAGPSPAQPQTTVTGPGGMRLRSTT